MLTSTVTLRECSTAPGLSGWGLAFVGHDQVDVLGAECGAGLDLRLDVARQVLEGFGVDLQAQLGRPHLRHPSALRCSHFADLDTAQLHLRAVLHDQAGPVGDQRERDERSRNVPENSTAVSATERDDHHQQNRCPPDGVDSVASGRVGHRHVTPTGGSCRTARRRTA